MSVLAQDTFRILVERGSRFTKILEIEGPVGEHTDAEIILWAGGSEQHGSRVVRYPSDPTHACVYAWED